MRTSALERGNSLDTVFACLSIEFWHPQLAQRNSKLWSGECNCESIMSTLGLVKFGLVNFGLSTTLDGDLINSDSSSAVRAQVLNVTANHTVKI